MNPNLSLRGAGRLFVSQLLKLLTRVRFPGLKRVYCADPKIGFLNLNMRSLQVMALTRGIQLIWFDTAERKKRQEQLEIKDASTADRPAQLRLMEYSVAVDAECQLAEVERVIKAGKGNCQQYTQRASVAAELIKKDVARIKPNLVLLAQGFGVDAVAARMCAVKSGLPLLAFENTALKNKVVWEPISGVTVNRNIARSLFLRYMDVVSEEEVQNFCETVVATTKQNKQDEHTSPDRQWVKATDRPVVLYLGQVYTDSSLLYGCYEGLFPEDVVRSLATWCKANDAELVLKLHPKEATGADPVTNRPYDKLTMRKLVQEFEGQDTLEQPWTSVDSENQWDTYSLIESANVVVTINSQAGLEAAIRGKNVITSGRCFYAGLDFTTDVVSTDAFASAIEDALECGYSEAKHHLAQKFFYIFFEKYCVTKTTTEIVKLIKRGISYRF